MNELIKIEQIYKYIDNELLADELLEFEKQLKEDADLLEEVNATIVLKAKYRAEQKQLWNQYEEDYEANPEKWKAEFDVLETIPNISSRSQYQANYLKYAIGAAASLLLFLLAYFLIPSPSPQTLAAEYWQEATAHSQFSSAHQVLKGGQSKQLTEDEAAGYLQQAYDSYKYQEYKSVLNTLRIIPPESHHHSKALILSGIAHFQLKENKKAINQFKKILNDRNISGNDDARKYLALIYLQTNELTEAKKVLKEIIEAGDRFAEEAKELLKRLE